MPPRRRLLLPLAMLYLMQVTGCTTWQAQTGPVPEVVGRESSKSVRVTLADSSRVTLLRPRLEGDTLVGASVLGTDTTEQRLARSDIARIEARRTNGGLTALVVILSLGTALAVASLVALSQMEPISFDLSGCCGWY